MLESLNKFDQTNLLFRKDFEASRNRALFAGPRWNEFSMSGPNGTSWIPSVAARKNLVSDPSPRVIAKWLGRTDGFGCISIALLGLSISVGFTTDDWFST
jgi:hypothetical protein